MILLLVALASAAEPSDAAIVQALSVRHDPPPCAALEAGLTAPADTWARIAEHAEGPPWVSVRAAACLLPHAPRAEATLRRWVVTPALAGLADVVLAGLDAVPDAQAIDLGRRALAGPLSAAAARRLAASPRPALRALAVEGR